MDNRPISRVVFGDPGGEHLVLDLNEMSLTGGQRPPCDIVMIDLIRQCRDARWLAYQVFYYGSDRGIRPTFLTLLIRVLDMILDPLKNIVRSSSPDPQIIKKGKMRELIEENIRRWDQLRDELECPPFTIEYDDGRKVPKIR